MTNYCFKRVLKKAKMYMYIIKIYDIIIKGITINMDNRVNIQQ